MARSRHRRRNRYYAVPALPPLFLSSDGSVSRSIPPVFTISRRAVEVVEPVRQSGRRYLSAAVVRGRNRKSRRRQSLRFPVPFARCYSVSLPELRFGRGSNGLGRARTRSAEAIRRAAMVVRSRVQRRCQK